MEKKDHYRLYKSGKRWLAALVVTVAGGAVLTTAGPTVQAADTDDAAKVTAAEPASWETQLAALKSAVAAGNWGNLTVNNQTVSAVLAGVTDEASFNSAWSEVAQTIISNTVASKFAKPADQTAFIQAQSTDAQYAGKTNAEVLSEIIQSGAAAPDFGAVLNHLITYTTTEADQFQPATDDPVKTNKNNLTAFLQANSKIGQLLVEKKDGTTTTVTAIVAQAADADSLAQAWSAVAQAVITNEMQAKLNLPDTTSAASRNTMSKLLAAKANGATVANNQVLANVVAANTPSTENPELNVATAMGNICEAVDSAVANTQLAADWQENKDSLLAFLQSSNLGSLTAPTAGGSLTALVNGVQDTAGLTKAWGETAQAVLINEMQTKLGLADTTSVASRSKLADLLNTKSSDTHYSGDTNGDVFEKVIAANTPSAANPTPNFATLVTSLRSYVTDAVKAENLTGQSQVVIRDWANGVIINQRSTTVTSGQTIPLYAAAHDGLSFDSVKIDGVTQSTTNGTLNFSRTFSQSTTYYVDYYFIKSTGYTEKDARGTVYIKNTNGAALYSNMNMTAQITDRNLKQGTAWASYKKVYDAQGNVVGYNLGGQQYVKASDVQETPIGDVTTQTFNGVVSVINPWTPVYSDSAMTKQINNWTLDAGTRWQVFQKVFIDGKLAGYNLGGQQFIKANAVQQSTTPSTPQQQIIPNSGVVSIISPYGARVYSDAAMTKDTGRVLPQGARYQYNNEVYTKGQLTAFNVGGNQFISVADIATQIPLYRGSGTFTVRYPANPRWGVAVLDSNLQVLKIIPAGTHWRSYGIGILSDGRTYYSLGGNQWVPTDYGFVQ
jgi:hypothetical protein